MSPHNVRISHNITGVVQRVRRSEMLSAVLRRRGFTSSAPSAEEIEAMKWPGCNFSSTKTERD